MRDLSIVVAAWLLALSLGWAGVAKIVRPASWNETLERYGFSGGWQKAVALGVPALELALAGTFVAGVIRPAAAVTIGLLAAFSLSVLNARALQGHRLPCGCFGGSSARDYRLILLRNAALGGVAAFILMAARGEALRATPSPAEALPVLLIVAGIAAATWMIGQVRASIAERGRS